MQYDDTSLFSENWSREKLLEELKILAEHANYYERKWMDACARKADVRREEQQRARAAHLNDKVANARLYTDQLIGESLTAINALVYQVEQLGDRAGTAQMKTLKATAERAKQRIHDARPNITDYAQRAWELWLAEAGTAATIPPV